MTTWGLILLSLMPSQLRLRSLRLLKFRRRSRFATFYRCFGCVPFLTFSMHQYVTNAATSFYVKPLRRRRAIICLVISYETSLSAHTLENSGSFRLSLICCCKSFILITTFLKKVFQSPFCQIQISFRNFLSLFLKAMSQ